MSIKKYLEVLYESPILQSKTSKIKEKYDKKRKELIKHKNEALEKLKDFGKDVGKDVAGEMTEKIRTQKAKIRSLYLMRKGMLNSQEFKELEKVKNVSKKSSLIISGIGLASIIIYTSYKIYKENEKKYERMCKDKKGKDKEKCIIKNRIIALEKRLKFLNNSAIKCNYSKNPVKCKDKLDEEMLKIRERIRNYSNNIMTRITGEE